MRWLSKLASAQVARAESAVATAPFHFRNPTRLIIACAFALSFIVLSSASFIVYSLRHRVLAENEQTLSNSALIIAKQIEQILNAVENVQKGFYDDLSRLPVVNEQTIENDLRRLDVHLKLRDKAGGMPYVSSLDISTRKAT